VFEAIILACVFANSYSVDLVCKEEKLLVPSCYAVEIQPPVGTMIKEVACNKYVPVVKELKDGEGAA
jgi:hypothetical protein